VEPAVASDLDDRIAASAAPDAVRGAVAQLLESPDAALRLSDARVADATVALMGASRSLTRQLISHPDDLDVLTDLGQRVPRADLTIEALVRWKQQEYLRIAARDLLGTDTVEVTAGLVADLAADVLHGACLLAETDGLAVIGMGKLGGHELNYASDVDVLFVGDGPNAPLERQARKVMELTAKCFRIDANLRPQGRDGPLVRSVDSYEAYWDRWAEPWEFQALLKAVPAAGDPTVGRRFFDAAQRWLWNRPFDAESLRSVRHLKSRAESEVARKGLADREIKRGPGGIRDIEFTVQLLQLVHGHSDVDLRSPTTLAALAELAGAGFIDTDDATHLAEAYRHLRIVEHRLQLLDEAQTHTLPDDPALLDRVARATGYRDRTRTTATEQFTTELRAYQLRVRTIHERVYFRPLLEAFAGAEGGLSPEAAVERLNAFGFTDAKRTQAAVRELTRGLNRSSRLMQQMLPLLLDWLSASADPDLGLLQLRNLLSGRTSSSSLLDAFRDSPEVARRLCLVLGTSRIVGARLQQNPDLVPRLGSADALITRSRPELIESASKTWAWRTEDADRRNALRRWTDRHTAGIMIRDLLDEADVPEVGRDLTALGDAVIDNALAVLDPQVPFAVIAMGRYGGGELSYASDLDVLFVYDNSGGADGSGRTGAAAVEEAQRVANGLRRMLTGSTPVERIWELDADLRPEGRQGPLARSVAGYVKYWDTYALVWERQAMLRARPAAGNLDLASSLLDQLAPRVWGAGLSDEDRREIRRIKARVERERMPPGEDARFHLKLGRGSLSDIEWTAQLLQLEHGVVATGTMAALDALEAAEVLDGDDAEVLREAYRFCERTRNRWYLVNSKPGDSLPTQPEPLMWLARSLDMGSGELRETYRRVTRRSRSVVERLFYGQS
jgi:glutamate-ammonia-ligase adenylyltransferase